MASTGGLIGQHMQCMLPLDGLSLGSSNGKNMGTEPCAPLDGPDCSWSALVASLIHTCNACCLWNLPHPPGAHGHAPGVRSGRRTCEGSRTRRWRWARPWPQWGISPASRPATSSATRASWPSRASTATSLAVSTPSELQTSCWPQAYQYLLRVSSGCHTALAASLCDQQGCSPSQVASAHT